MPFFPGIISPEHRLTERGLQAATQEGLSLLLTVPSLCMLGSEQLTHCTLTLTGTLPGPREPTHYSEVGLQPLEEAQCLHPQGQPNVLGRAF